MQWICIIIFLFLPTLARATGQLQLTKFYKKDISDPSVDIKIGGDLTLKSFFFLKTRNQERERRARIESLSHLDGAVNFGSHFHLYGNFEQITYGPQSRVRTVNIPKETYLDIYTTWFDLRFGIQRMAWGVMDIVSPLDRLNPVNLIDVIDNHKEGLFALKMDFSVKDWHFQPIWIPIPGESRLPEIGDRFFPVGGVAKVESLLPKAHLENSQGGIRVQKSFGPLDLGGYYLYSFENIPQFELVTQPTGFLARGIFPRFHLAGLSTTMLIKKLILRQETVFFFPERTGHTIGGGDRFHLQYVGGLEYQFTTLPFGKDLTCTLEFTQLIQPDKRVALISPFQKSILPRLKYRLSEFFNIQLQGSYDFDQFDYLFQSKLAWSPLDDLEWTFGFDLMGGPGNSFFGLFEDNDRFFAKILYTF